MPDILTPEQVAECRERAERATEGPWIPYENYHGWHMMIPGEGEHGDKLVLKRELEEANIKFACSARTDIPALCATVEALWDVVEWQCRTKCAGYSSECTDRCRAAQVFRARELSR